MRRGSLSFSPSTTRDVTIVAATMSQNDREECRLLGFTPFDALLQGYNDGITFTIHDGETTSGMCGVTPIDADSARVWFLGTEELRSNRSFIRCSISMRRYFHRLFPCLENIVPATSEATIGWLTFLGFTFDLVAVDVNGNRFLRFVRCDYTSRNASS